MLKMVNRQGKPYIFELCHELLNVDIAAIGARSIYVNEEKMLREIGRRSLAAGVYTKSDFVLMCESVNANKRCWVNSEELISCKTQITLSTTSEQERINSLMCLPGVSWFTASALLHYTFEDQYPMLVNSVLWSWGYKENPPLCFEFWWAYVEASRKLMAKCQITMPDLICALRQFKTEHTAANGEGQPLVYAPPRRLR